MRNDTDPPPPTNGEGDEWVSDNEALYGGLWSST